MANPKGTPKNLMPPVKKGEVRNPHGRPADPPELKEIKKMSKGQLELLMWKVLTAKPDELKNFKSTVLELWLASGITKGIQGGDFTRLNWLVERLHGKVKETVVHEGGVDHKITVTEIDIMDRINLLKKAEPVIEVASEKVKENDEIIP